MKRIAHLLFPALIAVLFGGCSKEPLDTPPPIALFRTYDIVPISAEAVAGGHFVTCKRALGDQRAAYVQFFNTAGDPGSRIEFDQLPRSIENITFRPEDMFITDVLRWDAASYVLAGFAIQRDLEDRVHALVYHVNAQGQPVAAPRRRYLGAHAELVAADDINELYRTRVLAERTAQGDLLLAARYETSVNSHFHLLRIPNGAGSTARSLELPGAPARMGLQFLHVRSNGEVLLGMDIPGTGLETQLLIRSFQNTATDLEPTGEVTLQIDHGGGQATDPTVTGVHELNGTLLITGTCDIGQNEPRLFHTAASDLTGLASGNVIATDNGRAAVSYGAAVINGEWWCTVNLFESSILGEEAERNDRISDLRLLRLGDDGSVQGAREVLTGQGIRGLACFPGADGIVVFGALHPFLNIDYLHGAFIRTEP